MTSAPPIEFQWYERTPGTVMPSARVVSRENGESPLFKLMKMYQPEPTKHQVRRHRAPNKLKIALEKIAEFRQRQEDAADVLSGKKIAVTQEEWDRANDQP